MEVALEGVRATRPGAGTPDATPYIAQGRGLVQGLYEKFSAFVTRLLNYRTTWNDAGWDTLLVEQIQIALTAPDGVTRPLVRLVDRSGQFTSIAPDGTITRVVDLNWNWDGISHAERNDVLNPWWSDVWIIVYPPPAAWVTYATTADANYLAAWAAKQFGIGHACDRATVDQIRGLVRTWKGAHCYMQAIIWSTDVTLFVPGSLGATGNPDGTWGNWGRWISGVYTPVRTTVTGGGTVRYWTPERSS